MGGGMEFKRKIHWVKWRDVNLSFDKGGLGVKNIALFNLALLFKWRWKILQGTDSLWFSILKARYGDLSYKMLSGDKGLSPTSSCSFWWRDLVNISHGRYCDPIVECSSFSINNGFNTPF